MTTVLIALIALAAGYGIGRYQPWNALDAWAEDQVRFMGPWATGNKPQMLAVWAAHWLTHPRHSWRAHRKGRR